MKRKFRQSLIVVVLILVNLTQLLFANASTLSNGKVIKIIGQQHLYSASSVDSIILATLENGETFKLIESEDGWNKVSNWKYTGYIESIMCHESDTPVSFEEDSALYKYAIVNASLNLRENPTKKSKSMQMMKTGTLVIVHDTSTAPWWFVEYNGVFGYSHCDYLTLYEECPQDEIPLAVYTTSFSVKKSQEGRVYNINKAAGMLNGTSVMPGETFSILSIIAPITQKNGYKEAPEYVVKNGEAQVVTGYGGGVCQVSTTLYNTFLITSNLLDLKTVERHTHALPVTYVPDGMDATISYSNGKDFRFKNNSNYELIIRTYTDESGTISVYITRKENIE